MQISTIHKAKLIKFAETLIKIIIVLLGCWFLYKKIICNPNIADLKDTITESFTGKREIIIMICSLAMMPFNLLLEAFKWKTLIKPLENLSIKRSYQAIFTGITAGMFFPNRTGDFLGRIFTLEQSNRIKAAMLSFVGNIAQSVATISFGCIALISFIPSNYKIISIILTVAIIVLLLLIFYNIHILRYLQFLVPKKYKDKTEEYMNVFVNYNRKELSIILALSIIRYILYCSQFVLLSWAFNIPLSYFNIMIPVSLTYLAMMMVPFISMMEIAVRGSVCIMVFDRWFEILGISTTYSMMAFSASTMLWIINIAIPAVTGLFLINKLKFFRKS